MRPCPALYRAAFLESNIRASDPRTNHFSDFPSTSCLNGELLLGLYLDHDRADCHGGA